MNVRWIAESTKKILLFAFFLFLISPYNSFSQNEANKRYAQQALMVYKVLAKYHYKPQELNDALSEKLNKEFLNTLDPTGLYFTKKEYQNEED